MVTVHHAGLVKMFWQCPDCKLLVELKRSPGSIRCVCGYRSKSGEDIHSRLRQFSKPIPYICPDGRAVHVVPGVDPEVACRDLADKFPTSAEVWRRLHSYAVEKGEAWSPEEAKTWFNQWCKLIPSAGCECMKNWNAYLSERPPEFSSASEFFRWTVEAHNYVSQHHVVPSNPTMTLGHATELYGLAIDRVTGGSINGEFV